MRNKVKQQVAPDDQIQILTEEEDDTTSWWSMKDVALAAGEDFSFRKIDDITRRYRRRVSDNVNKFTDFIKLDRTRGWIIEPKFAQKHFNLPPTLELTEKQAAIVESDVVEFEQDEE